MRSFRRNEKPSTSPPVSSCKKSPSASRPHKMSNSFCTSVDSAALCCVMALFSTASSEFALICTVSACEIDEWQQQFILDHHSPGAMFGDALKLASNARVGLDAITETDKSMPYFDLLFAGFECDSVSA